MKSFFVFWRASLALFCLLAWISASHAHIAISNPPGQAGPWSKDFKNTLHAFMGYQGKKFPCGGYNKGPVTTYRAGQVINVRFWNFAIKDYQKFPPPSGIIPARHGGGACEFSLSYDGGKTWKVIGQYTRTCPDIYFEWPVMIPKNVPPCSNSDKCLFAFSWVAYLTNQFYHHCSNIIITQNATSGQLQLPELDMTVVDVAELGQPVNTRAKGDGQKGRGPGPNPADIERSTNGFYAFGGGAGKVGIDLELSPPKRT
ncbi:hypothetical protein BGW38_006355 [Lunasporangiospora selenospora]|uniref:Chitin-binding protein n=1 Tax=Lunasporangiospora selenospora TaxID=979761 RepID=A0A9P6G153_9FUNG|nr:hypothetical protein BGW38_006355 [Lunasporangiospora selenospora]